MSNVESTLLTYILGGVTILATIWTVGVKVNLGVMLRLRQGGP